jgi:crossover junction endodeoxyribonuclease RuvC
MIVAGIDPGFGGAIAVVNAELDCETCHTPTMGEGTQRMINAGELARFLVERDVEYAVVEQCGARPGQGVASMFRFGGAYYGALCVLQVLSIPYETVTPGKWKKAFSLTSDKELSRRRAIELLPRAREQFALKKDEARAEAALLALWHLRALERVKEAA